jgi:hypothetical protein
MFVDDPNPYASPRTCCRYEPEADPAAATAWRSGDVLLVKRHDPILPQACIKTNATEGLHRYSVTTLTNRSATLVLGLFLIPYLGLVMGSLLIFTLVRIGKGANISLWLRSRYSLRFLTFDLLTVVLILAGNLISGNALVEGQPWLALAGIGCTAAGIAIAALPFQLIGYLRIEFAPTDLLRIRGAHPDYLDRLPPFPTAAQRTPLAGEAMVETKKIGAVAE